MKNRFVTEKMAPIIVKELHHQLYANKDNVGIRNYNTYINNDELILEVYYNNFILGVYMCRDDEISNVGNCNINYPNELYQYEVAKVLVAMGEKSHAEEYYEGLLKKETNRHEKIVANLNKLHDIIEGEQTNINNT